MSRTDAAAAALPRIAPMLLRAGRPPAGREHRWAVELKWDGMRLAFAPDGAGGWCARSLPGRNCTDEFSELGALAEQLAGRQIALDDELVVLGADGRPDFAALRRRLVGSGRRRPAAASPLAATSPPLATYMVFDLLMLDGEPVYLLPYLQRRALLAELLADGPVWRVPDHWTGNLDDVVAITREHQLEGVVFKRQDGRYEPGRRSGAWLKLKHRRTESFAVTGWAPARADSGELDAFFVARADARGRLRPAGGVQLGLGGDARAQLRAAVQASAARRGRRAVRDVAAGITVNVHAELTRKTAAHLARTGSRIVSGVWNQNDVCRLVLGGLYGQLPLNAPDRLLPTADHAEWLSAASERLVLILSRRYADDDPLDIAEAFMRGRHVCEAVLLWQLSRRATEAPERPIGALEGPVPIQRPAQILICQQRFIELLAPLPRQTPGSLRRRLQDAVLARPSRKRAGAVRRVSLTGHLDVWLRQSSEIAHVAWPDESWPRPPVARAQGV